MENISAALLFSSIFVMSLLESNSLIVAWVVVVASRRRGTRIARKT